MPVIAALDDPLAILLADNFSDVMTPDHDCTDRRTAGIGAVMRPRTGKVIRRSGIGSDLLAHVPSAPGGWPPGQARVAIARALVTCLLMACEPESGSKARRPIPSS